jgi:SAM-dependent methyltransferase
LNEGDFVVDFGCSLGYTLNIFKEAGFDTLGVETSPAAADYARTVFGLNVDSLFFHDEMEFNYSKVDLFILSHVLEHIWNPVALLKTLQSLLSDKGMIYIEVPLLDVFDDARDPMPFTIEHVNYFSLNTMKRLINNCGMYLEDFTLIHNFQNEAPNYLVGGFLIKNSVSKVAKDRLTNLPSGLLEYKIQASQNRKDRWLSWLSVNKDKRIVVWGAGNMGIQFYSMAEFQAIMVDGNSKKQCISDKYQVYSPQEVNWMVIDVVVIASFGAHDSIQMTLKEGLSFSGQMINLFEI